MQNCRMIYVLRKCLFLFVIIVYTFNGLAQEQLKAKRFYLGFSFFSSYSKTFYPDNIFDNPGINYSSYSAAGPGFKQKQLVPYKFGLDFKIKITKRFFLSTGFFVDILETKCSQPMSLIDNTSGSNGIYATMIYPRLDFSTKFTYFEIPLRFDLRFTDKALSPFLTFGGYTGILYKAKYSHETFSNLTGLPDESSTSTSYFESKQLLVNQMYSNFQLGFGLDANIKKLKLQIFPCYDFGFLAQEIAGKSYTFRHRIGGAISITRSL